MQGRIHGERSIYEYSSANLWLTDVETPDEHRWMDAADQSVLQQRFLPNSFRSVGTVCGALKAVVRCRRRLIK